MKEQTIIYEPCPINEKDLCGDCLFEDVFDNGGFTLHPKMDNVAVGFIAGVPARAKFIRDGNELWVKAFPAILYKESKQVTQRLTDVVDMFNEEEQDRQLIASLEQESNTHYRIIYNYWYDEEDM